MQLKRSADTSWQRQLTISSFFLQAEQFGEPLFSDKLASWGFAEVYHRHMESIPF